MRTTRPRRRDWATSSGRRANSTTHAKNLSYTRELLATKREHLELPYTLLGLGQLQRCVGRPDEAEALLREALAGFERLPDTKQAAEEARDELAELHREHGAR